MPEYKVNKLFKEITDNVEQIFFIQDADSGEMIYVNAAYEKIFGQSRKNLYKNPVRYVVAIHPDDKEKKDYIIQKIKQGDFIFEIEFRIVLPDGTIKWVFFKTFPVINEKGEIYRIAGIVEDITERKQIEEKLKKINQTKDKMINVLAHDLKGPIKSMIGLAQLLEMESNLQENSEARNYVALIKKTGNSSIRLIEELLNIAELEDDQFHLHKEKINLVDLINSSLEVHRTIAGMKGIKISFDYKMENFIVPLDSIKFKQVLDNLVSNAIKFTPQSGRVNITLDRSDKSALVKIADNGIGIPEDKQSLLFDKFTKLRRKGTQGENTTGLGMAITKQILDLHQAKISFESKENEGTIFTISLPT